MRRLITLGIFLCVLSSAHGELPAELLSKDQMVAILVDLELAKAMVDHYADDADTARLLFQKNELLIYQAHETDSDTFQKSYQHYLTHLAKMQEIYELVIKQIEELSEQL